MDLQAPKITSIVAKYGESQTIKLTEDHDSKVLQYRPDFYDIKLTVKTDDDDNAIIYPEADGVNLKKITNGEYELTINKPSDDKGPKITIYAKDGSGNTSKTWTIETKKAEDIELTSASEEVLSPNLPVKITGTAQPGWTVYVKLAGGWEAVTANEEGEWEQEVNKDNKPSEGEIGFSYDKDGTNAVIVPFTYDDVVEPFKLDPVQEGAKKITGRVERGATVTVKFDGKELKPWSDDSQDEASGNDDAQGVQFTIELPEYVKLGQKITIWAKDKYENKTEEQPIDLEAREGELEITSVKANGKELVFTGRAEAGFKVEIVVWDDAKSEVARLNSESGEFKLSTGALKDGVYSYTATYADGMFEKTSKSGEDLIIDTTAPELKVDEIRDIDEEITGTLDEDGFVWVGDNGEEESVKKNISFTLSLPKDLDLYGKDHLTLHARDAAGNVATREVDVIPAERYLAGIDAPVNESEQDCTQKIEITGWILVAEDEVENDQPKAKDKFKLKLTLSSGTEERIPIDFQESQDAIPEGAEQQMKVDGARLWSFRETVDLNKYPLGDFTAEIIREDGSEVKVLGTVTWQSGKTKGARTRLIVPLVLLLAALGAVAALIVVVNRKIRRLKNETLDDKSRQSNLTIKKRA